MANTPLKNRKLPPWITEAVKHWRWQKNRLDPIPEVTAPKYSAAWMEQPRRRKAGQSLRDIADETRLGFQTVRTVVDKAASVDRATLARIQRIAPDMLAEAGERSRKRTRDALPRRINAALKDCAELRKRAKGIG